MTMIGFCVSPRAFVIVLRSTQGQESIITQEETRVPMTIRIPRATSARSRCSTWLKPAPCMLKKRRLAAESCGFREHTSLGKTPATWLYLLTAVSKRHTPLSLT